MQKGILSAFLRLCNLSVVTFYCHTYKFNTDLLENENDIFVRQLLILSAVALKKTMLIYDILQYKH